MRALEFFVVLAVGAAIGAAAVLSVVPDARLGDIFGPNSFVLTFTHQMNAMSHAARGIFIGLMWAIFGITIAKVWSFVFGGARSISRGETH